MIEDKEGRVKGVHYSKKFLKSLKRLPERIISEAEKKEKIFKENPFNPILKTQFTNNVMIFSAYRDSQC